MIFRLLRALALPSVVFLMALVPAAPSILAATVEYLDGTRFECKVLSKDDKQVTVEVMMGGMLVQRRIPLAKIHKVIINDKTYVINERSGGAPAGSSETPVPSRSSPATSSTSANSGKTLRTRSEVDALISEMGRQPPTWYDTTPLNYPETLDLSWPEGAPPGGWNNQKNVGQYIWDIVNPNPNRWREGVRLMHHLLTLHKEDPVKRVKIMNELGRMYFNLHQDFPRAAFWWRQAGVEKSHSPPGVTVHLAECYWRLGNKQMAGELLRKLNPIPYEVIKLWADMGEPRQALQIADAAVNHGGQPHLACLYAADACRVAGRYKEALDYYQKTLAVPATGNQKGQIERCHQRATASIEAIRLYDTSDVKRVGDGLYRGSALGYEGPVEVEIAVASGTLESVRVTQHKEKQFYSAMTDTPAKIISRQGVRGVDATSGATITSEAIINATAKALARGAK